VGRARPPRLLLTGGDVDLHERVEKEGVGRTDAVAVVRLAPVLSQQETVTVGTSGVALVELAELHVLAGQGFGAGTALAATHVESPARYGCTQRFQRRGLAVAIGKEGEDVAVGRRQ